jgi:hypothetical protein
VNTLMIGYDLIKPGKDYANLIDAIKKLGDTWWHCLDSTWIIKTNSTAKQVRDALFQHIDGNDRLLVVTLSAPAAWTSSFSEKCKQWLSDNL